MEKMCRREEYLASRTSRAVRRNRRAGSALSAQSPEKRGLRRLVGRAALRARGSTALRWRRGSRAEGQPWPILALPKPVAEGRPRLIVGTRERTCGRAKVWLALSPQDCFPLRKRRGSQCLCLLPSVKSLCSLLPTEEPIRLLREVVLLTDDRNLRVKALTRNVPVRDIPAFLTWAQVG